MNKKLYKLMNWPDIEAVVYNDEAHPFNILGSKVIGNQTLFQTFFPNAKEAYLVYKDNKIKMEMADELGYYVCLVAEKNIKEYSFEYKLADNTISYKDAYNYKGYNLSNKELAKFQAGINYNIYDYLGAFVTKVNNVAGTLFRVWAPNAVSVSVIGDFNLNTANAHIMEKNDEYGVFELFIPDVGVDDKYQYAIKTKLGDIIIKADPYGKKYDSLAGCSVVTVSDYKFNDNEYIKSKKNNCISILELNLSAYKEKGDKLIETIVKEVKDLGYTFVQFMPFMEHTQDSLYKVTSFYAISESLGGNDFIKQLIDVLHKNDIGVILDWPINHFPMLDSGMNNFDGTCLYEHLDPKKGIHPFLGTALFNYGRNEVSIYLLANAMYYLKEFHVDGLKVDSLASMLYLDYGRADGEWIANIYGGNENLEAIEFIKHLNSIVKKECPNAIMIASDDSGYPNMTVPLSEGGLGFDYKNNYNMVADYIDYLGHDPYDRSRHHDQLTLSYLYQYKENFINALNMDFVDKLCDVIPGNDIDKFNSIKLSVSYMMVHPGLKLNSNYLTALIHNKGLNTLIKDLNKIYANYPALYELDDSIDGFEWINDIDYNKCILSFIRKAKKDLDALYIVCNFANAEQKLSVGTNMPGKYKEIFNTDNKDYGGLGKVNKKSISVNEIGADNKDFSFEVKLAPLSMCIFKYVPFTAKEQFEIDKKKEAAISKTKALEYKELADKKDEEVKGYLVKLKELKKLIDETQKEADNYLKLSEEELNKAKLALDACK